MADRKKLIELLAQVQDSGTIVIPTGQGVRYEWVSNQKVADHLIASGVTFATDINVGLKRIPANGWSQRKNCASCAHASDTHFAEACGKCVVGEYEGRRVTDPSMWKPRTKADRIRAMTDEELAKLLYDPDSLSEKYCKNLPECGELLDAPGGIPEEKCIGCMLNWLRQPAEVG